MVAYLITVVCTVILLAGGLAISVRLHNTLIKGQRLSGSQRFYAASRRYATDLADAGMTYGQRNIVTLMGVLLVLSVMAIGAVINVIAR